MVNSQLDVEYDSELLDALLSAPDFSSAASPAQSSPDTDASAKGNVDSPSASLSAFSRYFMIGGSLFTRRRCPAAGLLRRPRLSGAECAWLDFGSIYCPFTRQFVSLRSPHWSHLRSAGFGVDLRLRNGRRVALVRPAALQQTALSLQRGEAQKTTVPLWSVSLRSSLGALLEAAPASDAPLLAQRVREVICAASCNRSGRRIPLGFFDISAGESRSFAWEKNADDDSEAAAAFGEMFLRQALAWRTAVLQTRPKTPPRALPPPFYSQILRVPSETRTHVAGADLIAKYAALHALPFVVPGQRMAYLSLPHAQSAAMPLVVNAALRACASPHATLLYCPIQHGIDYQTVADLRAFTVRWTKDENVSKACAPNGEESGGAVEWRGPGVPLLDVGMPGTAAGAVVIVENAHLLSRRAIARLLDQWTRNGAARDAVKHLEEEEAEREEEKHKAAREDGGRPADKAVKSPPVREAAPRRRQRRKLLLSDAEVISAGMPLFGDTRAVFIGHARADSLLSGADASGSPSSSLSSSLSVVSVLSGSVAVLAPALEPVVSLDEPFAAAARRAAPLFSRMPRGDQRRFIALLCAADENTDEDELLRRHAWLDALLHAAAKGGLLDCEEILAQRPSLAATRICHALLREYPIVFVAAEEAPDATHSAPRRGDAEEKLFPPLTTRPMELTLFDSRHAAREFADAAHDKLRRDAALAATRGNSNAARSVAPAQTEYVYEAFLEPPVLLGRWTCTLFFCGPALADVLLLRRALLHDAAARLASPAALLDVDVFHVDYVIFSPDRRCRLFGARLRYARGVHSSLATAALRGALAANITRGVFFPLWPPPRAHGDADECRGALCLPVQTERRLFACAAAQCAPLRLAVGARVIARRRLSREIARGAVCRVVRFAPAPNGANGALADIFAAQQPRQRRREEGKEGKGQKRGESGESGGKGESGESGGKGESGEKGERGKSGESENVALFPVVRAESGGADAVVPPVSFLIGGSRALHHYALPALQLPLLAPGGAAAASALLHPLFAHDDALMEFAAPETRAAAAERLMQSAARDGFAAHAFVEDAVFEGNAIHAQSRARPPSDASMTIPATTGSSPPLQCEVLSALSLFPRCD